MGLQEIISIVTLLITLVTKSHDPLSRIPLTLEPLKGQKGGLDGLEPVRDGDGRGQRKILRILGLP